MKIETRNIRNRKYGIEIISNRTPFLWANVSNEYKLATSWHDFKLKIKNWHCNICIYVCRLCQIFQQNLGFLWNHWLNKFLREKTEQFGKKNFLKIFYLSVPEYFIINYFVDISRKILQQKRRFVLVYYKWAIWL